MNRDFGIDLEEVFRVIDSADVLIIRFHLIASRLLLDARTSALDGPLLKVVPRAGSVEERFQGLRRLRPRFPVPDKILSFQWPRQMETLRASGVWERIVQRLDSTGWPGAADQAEEVWTELQGEERRLLAAAIRGGEGFQSLWERRG